MKKLTVWFGVMTVFTVLPLHDEFNKSSQYAKDMNDKSQSFVQGVSASDVLGGRYHIPHVRSVEESYISEDSARHPEEYLNTEGGKYGRSIYKMRDGRPPYRVDSSDPMIKRSDKILKKPKEHLKAEEAVIDDGTPSTIETCEDCDPVNYLVKGRREKKRYVYLDKPPYIEAGATCANHGHLTIRVELINESDGLFLENGEFKDITHVRTIQGDGSYVDEVYRVNDTEVTLRKTIRQNGHPWIHPKCYLVPALQNHVLSDSEMIKNLLGGEIDRTFHWGEIGSARLYHRVVNDTEQHYWIQDDVVRQCEAKADIGECEYLEMKKDPPSDKFWKGKRIRDSWGETVTYSCRHKCKDTCIQLKKRGCSREVNPDCIKKVKTIRNGREENACLIWRWRFRCFGRKNMKKHVFKGENPFCMGGDCIDSSYERDEDFGEAMSQLSMLNEIGKEMKKDIDVERIDVFTGRDLSCTKYILDFSDCCKKGGWGQSLGFSKCNNDEKDLAIQRGENRCVNVGTHCTKREPLTKTCIQKKTVFCCFGSKFSRIMHEQGRSQLGMNFGTSKSPNCRGFTAQELAKIDFSKLDLSELYQEMINNFHAPSPEHFAKGDEFRKIQESFEDMKDRFKSQGVHANEYLQENLKHMASSMNEDDTEE